MNKLIIHSAAMMAMIAAIPAARADQASLQFIRQAIEGNLAEEKIGQLAEEKGASEQVRSFGAILKEDHTAANDEAVHAAKTLGVEVPREPSASEQALYMRLSKLSGEQFDKEFIKAMLEDHKKDVQKYEVAAQYSNDTVGSYANDVLPKLRMHLQKVEELAKA